MMTMTAAVLRSTGGPFTFEELQLEGPRPDEVMVGLSSTGLCHTDLAVVQGTMPAPTPIVLGHEGAGTVMEVGAAVRDLSVGDEVAMSFASCGHCRNCLTGREAYCAIFERLNFGGAREDGSTTLSTSDGLVVHGSFFGQSSFASHAVVAARNVVRLPAGPGGIDLDLAGPMGCGFQTGAGAIINSLRVTAGDTVVISGAGAVGLSALMAAKAVGATTIIVVDVLESRLRLARDLGASHTLDGRQSSMVQHIQDLTHGGADYALDTSGVAEVITRDVESVRNGGTIALVGTGDGLPALRVPTIAGKTIRYLIEGDSVPRVFIPQLIALHELGSFPVDRLVTRYPFAEIDQALADTRSGVAVKAVLTFD